MVQAYISEKAPSLPQGLKIAQYNVAANLISERIWLMIENGLSGLVLVLLVLFAFLPWRVAFWVAAGIPVAFLATFGVMFATGQSINMISLFGLIMALGIVVDDAIVIGEHAEHLRRRRNLPLSRLRFCLPAGWAAGDFRDADHSGCLPAALYHQRHYRGDYRGDSGGGLCCASGQPD